MNENKKNGGAAIVLNRMYVGKYLFANLGHEIINLYQADNGGHYIYLNSTGNFSDVHTGKIGYMLFVKYHIDGAIEVIGKATGLSDVPGANMTLHRDVVYNGIDEKIYKLQEDYIKNEKGAIQYGGVSILDIFNGAEQQSIFITYKAEKVYKPKKRIFICYGAVDINCNEDYKRVDLEGYNQATTSLKCYIYPEGTFKGDNSKGDKNKKKEDYNNIYNNIINVDDLWDEFNCKADVNSLQVKSRRISLFDICHIQDDENVFSNTLAYFMAQPNYNNLWAEFFSKVKYIDPKNPSNEPQELGIKVNFTDVYKITREEGAKINDEEWKKKNKATGGGRIDIVVRDNENIIVIENKIKSDVNTVPYDKKDKTQLNRYVDYVRWSLEKGNEKEGAEPHFIILTPNYNIPNISNEMKDYYKLITYSCVYDFLNEKKDIFKNDANFVAFFEAMERHTHKNVNDYLYYEMQEKFYRRIKK